MHAARHSAPRQGVWREIEEQQARCGTPALLSLTCSVHHTGAGCMLPPFTHRTPPVPPPPPSPKTNHHHHPTLRRSLCVMSLARGAGPSMASMTDLRGCVTLSSRSRRLYSSSW